MSTTPNVDYDLLFKLAEQARRTRALQQKYIKNRTQTSMFDAKKAEGVLDILLQRFEVAVELAEKTGSGRTGQPPLLPPK